MEMDQRANFLALCLLDAMEDENPNMIDDLLSKYDVDPNVIIQDRGIAPIHYSSGMPNIELSEKITSQLLDRRGDPNVCSEDKMTPMHVAAIHGRANIIKMLLKKGGKLDVVDVDRKTPILYAIEECHFDVVKVMQDHIFEQKYQKKQQNLTEEKSPQPNKYLTLNGITYNFDATSPYYINITHRRKPPRPCYSPIDDVAATAEPEPAPKTSEKLQNIFELTEENISEISKKAAEPNNSPMSLIQSWREKVQRAKSKQSILQKFNDVDSLVKSFMNNDKLDFTNTVLDLGSEEEDSKQVTVKAKNSFNRTAFGKIVKTIEEVPTENDESFYTATDPFESATLQAESTHISDSNFIRSPKSTEYYVQMTEAYVHTDDENGLVFYETKLLSNLANKKPPPNVEPNKHDQSSSSDTTNMTIPLDYETEALRAELTHFGDPPGPITKTTKKLYIKRLIKYKRNTALMQAQLAANEENRTRFSVELDRTVRSREYFEQIPQYLTYEQQLRGYFQSNQNAKRLREGHLKQSFIYMLIDPRVSSNLPGESVFMNNFEVWKRFLQAVFYVGKGKSTRPYSHLYDAMKKFSRQHGLQQNKSSNNSLKPLLSIEVLKSPSKQSFDTKKLDRILDIWSDGKGVVCLHVFHNIIPIEAYTREAAIIDALSLQHLTNLKKGDYYGPTQSWTMRAKKCMGVALLFKAMKIYLAEGESQLSPSDLI